jgi:predicted small integral membrane protein
MLWTVSTAAFFRAIQHSLAGIALSVSPEAFPAKTGTV